MKILEPVEARSATLEEIQNARFAKLETRNGDITPAVRTGRPGTNLDGHPWVIIDVNGLGMKWLDDYAISLQSGFVIVE